MGKGDELKGAIPHGGRGKRTAALIAAIVGLGLLIWFVVSGFEGRQIKRNAAALTKPVLEQPQPVSPRPANEPVKRP